MLASLSTLLLIFCLSGCQTADMQPGENLSSDWEYQAEELFDKSQMLSANINMNPTLFERMEAENRFSPEHLSNEELLETFFEYIYSTQVFPDNFNWYDADISINGMDLKNVGIRQKGFLGSGSWPVPGLKIRTDKYISGQNIAGEEYFTFNNASGDWTRLRTCLTFELFAAADYPAPLCNLARIDLNGEPLGIYVHVEPIKESFLRRNFGNDTGSLYEGMLAYLDANYLARFESKTDHTDPEKMELAALMDALDSPDEELVQNLSEHLNIELFITFWALEMVSSQIDGYSGNQNNFYIYFNPADDNRAVFIPWGVDESFVSHDEHPVFSSYHYLRSKIPGRLAGIPEMRQLMEAEVNRILDEVWNTEAILNSINSYEGLIIDNADYYSQPMDMEQDYRDLVEEVRLFVMEQPEKVLENLQPMFDLTQEANVYGIEGENQSAGEQDFFVNMNWDKLMEGDFSSGSGWIGDLVSRVRHDLEGYQANGNRTDGAPDAWEPEASPTDWLIAMLLISDDTPNLIIIALALTVFALTSIFRRIS